VFQSVIRYNVRLRETVDYGLPVGDYDRHAIGHKDYEKLADEVVAQKPRCARHGAPSVNSARHIARKAAKYIREAGQSKAIHSIAAELDDLLAEGPESSYSEMIDIIARGGADIFSDGDDF